MAFRWRGRKGGDPENDLRQMRRGFEFTARDVQYGADRQRARMLQRTEQKGVDVNGTPFKPYSEKGPYYYNPNAKDQAEVLGAGAVGRIAAKKSTIRREATFRQKAAVNRLATKTGAAKSSTGRTLKFDSYADFKRSLGRTVVDLRGPRAPHMLQAVTAKVQHAARQFIIGVYGRKAALARAHNAGDGVPKRRWFAASREEMKQIGKDIIELAKKRALP